MSQLDHFIRRRKKLDELSEWLVEQSYWTVQQVADHLSVSDETAKGIPREILPYVDVTPTSQRTTRRYAPTDVFAFRAFSAEYEEAKAEGEEALEAWMEKRRAAILERREELKRLAREAA